MKFPIGEAILGWVCVYLGVLLFCVAMTSVHILKFSTNREEYCSTHTRWNYVMPVGIIACWMSAPIMKDD